MTVIDIRPDVLQAVDSTLQRHRDLREVVRNVGAVMPHASLRSRCVVAEAWMRVKYPYSDIDTDLIRHQLSGRVAC